MPDSKIDCATTALPVLRKVERTAATDITKYHLLGTSPEGTEEEQVRDQDVAERSVVGLVSCSAVSCPV